MNTKLVLAVLAFPRCLFCDPRRFSTRRGATTRGSWQPFKKLWPDLLLIFAVFLHTASSQAQYTAVDMGFLGTSRRYATTAWAINNDGQAVGSSPMLNAQGGYDDHAFLYSGGTMTDLGTLPGTSFSVAYGINNNGQVVGLAGTYINPGPEIGEAFLSSGGTMTNLGSLGGDDEAHAINDSGQIVGFSYTTGGVRHAFLSSGGNMTDLGTLGGPESFAFSINDSGQVAGVSDASDGTSHAFLYSGGTMLDLGTVGSFGHVAQINNSGQIVGWASPGDNTMYAFLYSGGAMLSLGFLGGSSSWALGINNEGEVVGASYTASNAAEHAFLYTAGTMTDLNCLITNTIDTYLYGAYGINDSGQIIAEGENGHAYLLTLVPEPSSLLLATVAVLLLCPLVKRRRCFNLHVEGCASVCAQASADPPAGVNLGTAVPRRTP